MERTVDVSLLEIPTPTVQREQETAAKKRRISSSASRSVSTALLPSLASANSGSFAEILPHFEPLLSAKEPQKSVKQREMLSTYHIQKMRETAENCLLNLNAKSFSRIEAFVESAHASTNTLSSSLPIKELPVALILGENQSLHDSMASRFLDSKRFYFAVLNPMNASDIKSCFKAIALQVILEQSVVPSDSLEIQSTGADGMDEDEVEGAKRTKGRKRDGAHVDLDVDAFDQDDENPVMVEDKSFVNHRTRKLAPHDIRALKSWWNAQPNSPAKSRGIVICVPEFERFNVAVFSHFVKVCSASMNEIPFTLLLGISTTLDIVFNACDKSVVRLLRCERFHLSKSDETVDALVSEHGNVQMTHDVFSQIFNGYWSNHKSIHALLDATQYSIMAHFHANPVSALMQADLDNVEIYPELLDRMRLLPSFEHHVQQLIEKDCLEEASILLNSRDPTAFLNLVQSARNDSAVHHAGIAFAIRIFMSTRELLKMPMPAGSVYSLYSRILGSDVDFGKDASTVKGFVGETCVLEVLKRLKAVKPLQLMEIVQSWQDAIQSFHYLDHVAEDVTAFERHVQQYHTKYKKKLKENDDSDTSDEEHRVQLNERLLPSSARKTRASQRAGLVGQVKEGSWVFFAGLVVDSFEALMRKLTRHHSTLLLNEIYYFGDYKILMKNFQPHPRPIIQTALGAASDYLACKCCKSNGTLHPSSLDMSIVYRLHSECGHLINVHDLFFGFELIVRNESPAPDMSSIQFRNLFNEEAFGPDTVLSFQSALCNLHDAVGVSRIHQTDHEEDGSCVENDCKFHVTLLAHYTCVFVRLFKVLFKIAIVFVGGKPVQNENSVQTVSQSINMAKATTQPRGASKKSNGNTAAKGDGKPMEARNQTVVTVTIAVAVVSVLIAVAVAVMGGQTVKSAAKKSSSSANADAESLAPLPIPAEATDPQTAALVGWLAERGVNHTGVFFAAKNGNRQVYTNKDFKVNEIVTLIPQEAIILDVNAAEDPTVVAYINGTKKEWAFIMSAFLTVHRYNSSWTPYLNTIPTYPTPLTWTTLELNALQATDLGEDTAKTKKEIETEWSKLKSVLPETSATLQMSDFLWSYQAVMAKFWMLQTQQNSLTSIIPIVDALNYAGKPNVKVHFNGVSGAVEMRATKRIRAGEQLNVTLNMDSTYKSLRLKGFTLPNNDKNEECRIIIMRENNDPSTYNMQGRLCLFQDLKSLTRAVRECHLGVPKEARVLKRLAKSLQDKLDKYRTTIEEDNAFLDVAVANGYTTNFVNAIRERRGEKVCLQKVLDKAEELLAKM
ncbi:hypothetical protein CcCBS67573_g05733 [Chytriomyces confervae]|uniref:SET domain-containing protein n=1 Tax=Chytriomyces confervae TaxID=246404 RepID=A0A507FAG8_9FUNG|nr:hypothetical protein CcCBS67573_g05733 [Chytriomyces confervae]